VSDKVLAGYNCLPVFLGADLKQRFYKGFCKQLLWPLFHYLLPLSPSSQMRFDRNLWQAYLTANKMFTDRVMEVLSPEDDYVWMHDYHLLIMPSFLRKRFHNVRIGFFLHSPFPSSEIFRTSPVREDILRSLLNADVVGFHTFDYARHFLSCCSRMLGLDFETKRGQVALNYYGRQVTLKIMPTGIKPERLLDGFKWADTEWRRGELEAKFKGKTVLVGVDDMDTFKGIELKLQAFEELLDLHPEWRGKLVLVQVANPARSAGRDIEELISMVHTLVERINGRYATGDYAPVHFLERAVPLHEKIALLSVATCCVVTATRDGMNLLPYEYIVCRQSRWSEGDPPGDRPTSGLVVSEFVGCSPSLSGAIRVNPWNIQAVADGIYKAITLPVGEQQLRHDKHWRYVSAHTVSFWAQSCIAEIARVSADHTTRRCYGLGFGLGFRVVALDPNFKKVEVEALVTSYQRCSARVILLDYDGTLTTAASSLSNRPTPEVLSVLRLLAGDERNMVYIVSGRGRQELGDWFGQVPGLGLAAEHGFFYRTPRGDGAWREVATLEGMPEWKAVALPIMQMYTESTDGSYVEEKETSMVWHYRDADPDFGSWQSKELNDHLDSVLANYPVEVVNGQAIVEVKATGVNKQLAVERVLEEATSTLKDHVDFVLCIGDDRSDEDMFHGLEEVAFSPHQMAEVYACTVGQKPSKARFYFNDTSEVLDALQFLSQVPRGSS